MYGDATKSADEERTGERVSGLRGRLLRAAILMVQDEGTAAISVREVARRAGVSSGAPFRHFKDRNALLAAIAEDGLLQLEAETTRAVTATGDDVVEQLKAIGVSFATFAATHPAHFRVMHDPSLGLDTSEQIEAIYARQKLNLREMLLRGQEQGLVRPGDVDMLALLCISIVGGLARLFVEGGPECPIEMPMQNLGAVEQVTRAVIELAGFGLLASEARPRYEALSAEAAAIAAIANEPFVPTQRSRKKKSPATKPPASAAPPLSRAQPGSPRAPRRSRSGPAR